jgi:hypothetical protein
MITPPANFTDRFPSRGPWEPPDAPPTPFEWPIEVLLPSGQVEPAV